MKKQSMVTKEASNRQHQTQGRPNHTHNPPNNFPQHQTHQKGGSTWLFKEQLRIYANFGQNSACICRFWPKTCVYMRILAKHPCMYVTFSQKPTYIEKKVVNEGQGSNQSRGVSIDEHTTKCEIEIGRNWEQFKHIVNPIPKEKERNLPSRVTNFVTKRKFLWLGGTTTDWMTP